jgi:hypothetical protein
VAIVLLGLVLAACQAIPTIPSDATGPLVSGGQQSATDENGTFRLSITTDQDRYRAGQAIVVTAAVTYLGPAAEIAASGSGTLVGFGVESGMVSVEPLFTGDCAAFSFKRDAPVAFPFVKSGSGPSPDSPTNLFLNDYFSSPDLRLPSGTWTIRAETSIYPNPECPGSPGSLSASLTVVVEP